MRIYQIAKGLAERHAVTCLTFVPDEVAEAALAPFHGVCRVISIHGPFQRSTIKRAWTTFASPLPDMALRNASDAYAAALRELLAHEQFDIVQAESIEMAPYLGVARWSGDRDRSLGRNMRHVSLVLDQFNAEYVIQKRAALTSVAALRRGQARARNLAGAGYSTAQWLKLARFERRVMRECDLVVAVSAEDRQTLQALAPDAKIGVVPNGVDTMVFSRAALAAERNGLAFGPHTIVFSGTLDYRPNIDALLWFANEVLPLIRADVPDTHFVVVGKRPAPAITALQCDTITIVGEVPDARPWIAAATVYVVPMRIGGGVRLKLLEALALEAPVISTTLGAEGVIGLHNGEQCVLADSAQAFAQAVVHVFADPVRGAQLGAAGRTLVQQHYDWRMLIPEFDRLYGEMTRYQDNEVKG